MNAHGNEKNDYFGRTDAMSTEEKDVLSVKYPGICTVSQTCDVLFSAFLSRSANEGSSCSFR